MWNCRSSTKIFFNFFLKEGNLCKVYNEFILKNNHLLLLIGCSLDESHFQFLLSRSSHFENERQYTDWRLKFVAAVETQLTFEREIGLERQIKIYHDLSHVLDLLGESTLSLACHHKLITLEERAPNFSFKQWIYFGNRCRQRSHFLEAAEAYGRALR
jgi:hypothetical protein